MKKLLLLAALAVPLAACADMTPTQQRALTGTAAGAGVGAVFGAIGGNAGLGAAAGAGPDWSAGFSSIAPDRPRTGPSKRASRPGAGGHRRRRPNEHERPRGRSNRSAVTFFPRHNRIAFSAPSPGHDLATNASGEVPFPSDCSKRTGDPSNDGKRHYPALSDQVLTWEANFCRLCHPS